MLPSSRLLPPSLSAAGSVNPEATSHGDEHKHRRVFIGPMPEKVISHTEARVRKSRKGQLFHNSDISDDEDDNMSQIIRNHAFNFFIHEGGNVEDWGENEERSAVEEMLRRWRNSEWGAIWSRRKKQPHQTRRWVGGSFEIGDLLGVNILKEPAESVRDRMSNRSNRSSRKASSSHSQLQTEEAAPLSAADTFVTARTEPIPSTSVDSRSHTPTQNHHGQTSGGHMPGSATSSRPLLRPGLHNNSSQSKALSESEVLRRPIIKMPSTVTKSDGNIDLQAKGKGKLVHYADSPIPSQETPGPAPPSEVLERTGSAIADTSSAATASTDLQPDLQWGDVVMRDRMLVRVSYTRSESIGAQFDEIQNRMCSHLQYEDWSEFLVAWRRDAIEIYENYSIPGKEWIMGHKHLAFIIPLKSSRTRLSLYSFVDLTFCLTCPPTATDLNPPKSRWLFHRAKEGTNIFVFKVKSRTRAYDWMWHLWRHLGGKIPQMLEIRNPSLNMRVKIDMPHARGESENEYGMFSRENVIRLCIKALQSVGDWKNIIERQMAEGKMLELAWRVDTNLDWIWLEDDVYGRPRPWAVLCGLALKQSNRPAYLEIRLGDHTPAYLHLKDGSRFHEPPAIEGYLDRIKPNTQTKQQIYLATHDGNIFSLYPTHAHPPSPPGLGPAMADSDTYAKTLLQTEVQRGVRQLMDAIGVTDLRSILLVRRAFHVVPQHSHKETESQSDGDWVGIWAEQNERNESDDEDEGGEEGMNKSTDRPKLKMKRAFELLLKNGHVVRFEAYSRRVAVEWIERLRALVLYWRQRHRLDAREEMDLAQSRRPRLTPHTHVNQDDSELPPEPPADSAAPLPALGSLYNWCVLERCKSVIRGGKIFMRRGLRGQYKLVQLFVIPGHLVQFRVKPKSSLHTSMRKKINLVDAYICSGYFAALALPKGQYSTVNTAPRRYQDGLEADDPEEDMLFMVWYRPQPAVGGRKDVSTSEKTAIPALSAKRKVIVFRTRSKLERDAWCWALNCEIEKIVRAQRVREEMLRDTGGLMKF